MPLGGDTHCEWVTQRVSHRLGHGPVSHRLGHRGWEIDCNDDAPTHLVYSATMYNSALMTHSQHKGNRLFDFLKRKKCQSMMLDNFISELCGNQNMPLAAPWWDNLFWALRQNPDFSSLPKMDLKQTGLTFTTKTFRWRSQEMYEIGAPPSLVRSLQSQYLICRVQASLYHF